jgi:hypothetical protein
MRGDEIVRLWKTALASKATAVLPTASSVVYIACVERGDEAIWLAGPIRMESGGATVAAFGSLAEVFDLCERAGVAVPKA